MRCKNSASPGSVELLEDLHHDIDLASAIARLHSESGEHEASGVLVTWHGPWSYTLELSHDIPPGLLYECVAP